MNKLELLIIFLVFSSNAIAYSFSISDIPISRSSNIGLDNPDPGTNSEGGNFESISGLPGIKRTIEPNYKDFTIKNKSININVKIPNYGRSFDNILIKETVDENFERVSNLHIYIDNPIFSIKREVNPSRSNLTNNIRNVFEMMKENYTIINNIIYIKIPRLNLGEDIVYNYTVKSNKSGIFCVDTLFRLDDSKWPDSLREDTIEIRPPEIEVDTLEDQLFAIRDEPHDITFNILHRSGWCNDITGISVFFNQSDKYDIIFKDENDKNYKKYDGRYIKLNLTPLEATSYPIRIKYHNAGKHPIPRLNVVGATVKQQNIEIDVILDEWTKDLQDYGAIFAAIFSVLSLIIAIFAYSAQKDELRTQKDELRTQQNELRTQQKEIHQIEIEIRQISQIHIKMENGADLHKIELNNTTHAIHDDPIKEPDNSSDR